MRFLVVFFVMATVIMSICIASAQPPGRRGGPPKPDPSSFVKRMMTFDANQDGQLSKEEVTDPRLIPLFERADENHDGIVTKEELITLYAKESTSGRGGPGGGMFGGRGPGGPGGPGMGGPPPGGPPPIGEVLPPHVKDMLRLSTAQRKKIEALQKMVESKLEQILTDEQKQLLDEMRHQGPGGPEGGHERFGPPPDGPDGNRPFPPEGSDRPQRPPE